MNTDLTFFTQHTNNEHYFHSATLLGKVGSHTRTIIIIINNNNITIKPNSLTIRVKTSFLNII